MVPSLVYRRRTPNNSLNASSEAALIIRRSTSRSLDSISGGNYVDVPKPVTEDLQHTTERWKNYRTRCIWGAIMLLLFVTLILLGNLAIVGLVIFLQTVIFKEVVGIAHLRYRERKLAWFRTINWYFLFIAYYFLYGESMIQLGKDRVFSDAFLTPLATHHRFISFLLYMVGLILFVLNLKKGHYKFQFNQFGLTHMTIFLVVCQAHFVIHNIFEGMFWFVFPVALVIWNDIMAYFFGFFFGRTPLIKISPKKTWEGFLGALFATVLFGWFLSGFLSHFRYLVCPARNMWSTAFVPVPCEISSVFLVKTFRLPIFISGLIKFVTGIKVREVNLLPIQLHSLAFSLFASLLAPFGGFFASGFKRAFKIKDFSDSIPGHGGLTDRMDCQFLMGFFVYIYFTSFLKRQPLSAGSVLEIAVSKLSSKDLLLLYEKLQEYLVGQELIPEV